MRQENAAHFKLVKQQNRKLVRNLLREESPQSIAQLAAKANLSYPTVAGLLKELIEEEQVIQCEELETCGGRPGTQYSLAADCQYGLLLYFKAGELIGKVYNNCGAFVKGYFASVTKKVQIEDIVAFVKMIRNKYMRITAISIGISGVVWHNNIITLDSYGQLVGDTLCHRLKEEFGVKVWIENDLNAICRAEKEDCNSFVHIAYLNNCVGSGIVLDGDIVEGSQGYAGEVEYLCKDIENIENTLVTTILAFTCVLNVPQIYISGTACSTKIVNTIKKWLQQILPVERIPKITVVGGILEKYEKGLLCRILESWENTY